MRIVNIMCISAKEKVIRQYVDLINKVFLKQEGQGGFRIRIKDIQGKVEPKLDAYGMVMDRGRGKIIDCKI